MAGQVAQLNICCPTLGDENYGTLINEVILLTNELKTVMNGHSHSGLGAIPTGLSSVGVVGTIASEARMNEMCQAGADSKLGTLMTALRTLVNEGKSSFNGHSHASVGVVASISVSATASVGLISAAIESVNAICVSLSDASLATVLNELIALSNEIKSAHNAHVHPTLATNPTDQTIASPDVTVLV